MYMAVNKGDWKFFGLGLPEAEPNIGSLFKVGPPP